MMTLREKSGMTFDCLSTTITGRLSTWGWICYESINYIYFYLYLIFFSTILNCRLHRRLSTAFPLNLLSESCHFSMTHPVTYFTPKSLHCLFSKAHDWFTNSQLFLQYIVPPRSRKKSLELDVNQQQPSSDWKSWKSKWFCYNLNMNFLQ